MNEDIRTMLQMPVIKWGIATSVIFLATFLGMQTLSLMKSYQFIGGGVPVSNTITVQGDGEVFAVPDIATFTFSAVEEAKTVESAQKNATDAINTMVTYLKEEGIDEKDIKTLSYNVTPRYEFHQAGTVGVTNNWYPPEGTRELVGFEVRQIIEVKVRDTEKAGGLLSGIGSRGASDISGLQFTIDDEETLRMDARKLAIQKAQVKAKQLAQDLNVRLIRVVSFSENGYTPFAPFGYAMGMGGDTSAVSYKEASPQVPSGENKITSNVSITYEIR
ncbi:MAG TPA: SIMPL domain-containing protein [Candidatus Paceibacterota bacterium]